MEDLAHEEPLTQPRNAWLFDVDGVITDPLEKEITEPEILSELIKRLEKGEPVGLNTGRTVEFIVEQVLIPLENKIIDRSLLNNIFSIGEMGAVWITYEDGERKMGIDESVTVPEDLKQRIRELVDSELKDMVYFDEGKRTMITLELLKGIDLDTFHRKQQSIRDKVKALVDESGIPNLRVGMTNIAVDVQNSYVGKALGARRFVGILEERGLKPIQFITFGDSPTDIEMNEELLRTGRRSKFVYVGKGEIKGSEKPSKFFHEGTLEYLLSN